MVAINTLIQRTQQFVDQGAGLQHVPVPNPDSHVGEIRVESVIEYSWQPLPALTVEASLDTKYSRIKQTGSAVTNQRTFSLYVHILTCATMYRRGGKFGRALHVLSASSISAISFLALEQRTAAAKLSSLAIPILFRNKLEP